MAWNLRQAPFTSPQRGEVGAKRRVRGSQRLFYPFENSVEVLKDIVVPEADNLEALSFKMPGTHAVFRLLRRMLPAIKFDDEWLR